MKFYAHSKKGKPVDEWHRLEEHLKGTAELAVSFAEEFGCGEWGRMAGLWQGWKMLFAHNKIRLRKEVLYKMEKAYEVSFEIAGPAAMFARPDTGSAPISYPVPTFSAVKGIFDAVLRRAHMYVQPTKVEICSPIHYQRYVTNYGGPLRSQGQIKDNNNYQLIATILVDVCYRIYGVVKMKQTSTRGRELPQMRRRRGKDWRLRFKTLFEERLKCGQPFYTPCLGWKEFVPSYLGPFREATKRQDTVDDIIISSFLRSMWDHRQLRPEYVQDWRIVKGVLSYIHQTPTEDERNAK